jgi:hypothetical protein
VSGATPIAIYGATSPAANDLLALPLNEFCRRVGISRALAYRLAGRGQLRFVKLGTRTIVPIAEIQRLLTQQPASQVS